MGQGTAPVALELGPQESQHVGRRRKVGEPTGHPVPPLTPGALPPQAPCISSPPIQPFLSCCLSHPMPWGLWDLGGLALISRLYGMESKGQDVSSLGPGCVSLCTSCLPLTLVGQSPGLDAQTGPQGSQRLLGKGPILGGLQVLL